MLFYSDTAGFKIARALAAKAKEGVEVRVMSDYQMSFVVRTIEKVRSSGTSNFSDLKDILQKSGSDSLLLIWRPTSVKTGARKERNSRNVEYWRNS